MAQPAAPPGDAPPLQPIIKNPLAPPANYGNSALRSPQFVHDPPSPQQPQLPPFTSQTSYFGQAHSGSPIPPASAGGSPNPNGILLNKGEGSGAPPPSGAKRVTSRDRDGRQSPFGPAEGAAVGLLRVSSPDGSTSESGFSSDGGVTTASAASSSAAFSSSTAPSSAVGSPINQPKPALGSLLTGDGDAARRKDSPPSPHCHFAPLPKVDTDRPGTRKNSFANRVKPFIPRPPPERSDSQSTTAFSRLGTDESSALETGGPLSPPFDHASALSQRLSSSLTFAQPPSFPSFPGGTSPSRPGSRRSSSSRRSRSPSPPGGSISLVRGGSSRAQSRSHSPNLSRHASTDALSLHYIEADADGRGGASLSRTNSRAGSERDGGDGAGGPGAASFMAGAGARRPGSTERRSTLPGPASGTGGVGGGGGGMLVDKDKEADVHRLQEKALHGNVDAERAVSPALQMLARGRSASAAATFAGGVAPGEGATVEPPAIRRKPSNEEVVAVAPGEERSNLEKAEELEEVEEEEEEEDEGDAEEENDDEDEDEDHNEEDNEEDDEPDRSRDEDDDNDEDEEEEAHEERKTSKGAAVEVVRWHRPDPVPAPSSSHSPLPPPVPEEEAIEDEEMQTPTPTEVSVH
ncbi:hypothetical protein JCM1840_003710 [Sporobolomyces johnsonii]